MSSLSCSSSAVPPTSQPPLSVSTAPASSTTATTTTNTPVLECSPISATTASIPYLSLSPPPASTTTTDTPVNQGRSTQEDVTGDVRKRRNVNGKESHPNQNDDDRITSSETTSQSQISLWQGCLGKLVIIFGILILVAVGFHYFFLS
ncbi:hypothetical protein GBAR_LOCUS15316 [Geodia barretti]|uniref:Uncharacterized protein n=1 Tax=Geodia barretti TaxID=519541 RepID=A0AA35SB09_GEOBA|nr:hypothetical protein GBAR_LOCUS15316 [Geodia barretti]